MTTNNETAISDSLSAAPDVPWAAAALDLVLSEENRPVANHSVRSWAFARLLRDHLDLVGEVDESLLFAGTVLHDIGLRRGARKPVRFEIDGADRAAEFLTAQGLGSKEVDKVWEAIAVHTTDGIPERRGPRAGNSKPPFGSNPRSNAMTSLSELRCEATGWLDYIEQ